MTDDIIDAPAPPAPMTPEQERFAVLRSALERLVLEVRKATVVRNGLGMQANVALNVAERTLKRYPRDDG